MIAVAFGAQRVNFAVRNALNGRAPTFGLFDVARLSTFQLRVVAERQNADYVARGANLQT